MSSGFYVKKDSALHRLHPVTRILVMVIAFCCALALQHPLYLLGLFLVFALAGARAGALRNLARVWWLLVLIAFASFAIWSLSYGGDKVVASWGPLRVTEESMLFGLGMGLRLDLMVFAGLVFLAATQVEEFTYGLTRMGLPFPVSFALSLSFRLMPLFQDTVGAIIDAQRARGLDPSKGGPIKRMGNYVPLLAPVFASSLRRTDQLAMALESKGFGLGERRGSLREYRAGWQDALAIIAALLLFASCLLARYLGHAVI